MFDYSIHKIFCPLCKRTRDELPRSSGTNYYIKGHGDNIYYKDTCSLCGKSYYLISGNDGILEMRINFISYPFLTALVILRYTLQSMGDYLAMPIFGFVEMIINISMAMMIPLIGYPAVCLGLALSRIGAGVTAILRYRGFMKKRCP